MSLVPQAKIAIPQVPPELVVRAGLRADLDTACRADVTLVCAPPGYGKTMLLADWAHTSTESDTAWVNLDPDDNDPQRLWTSVVAALAACPSVPPDSRLHAPWTAWATGPLTPSMVVTSRSPTAEMGVMQARTAWPARCTVQAPHWAMPQPNFVPVS